MKITLFTGPTFDIEKELGFPIKVVKSPRAHRLTLRIDEKARIPVLTLPPRCSARKAVAFVENHRDWIANMLARLPAASRFKDGDQISFMGQTCQIIHRPDARLGVVLENNRIIVSGEAEFLHRRIIDFLKKQAQTHLLNLSRQKAAQIGCTVNSVVIKDTKSRWGSCSTRRNINYNWRIVMAPAEVIDYLVCHEVAHLAHQDHSPAFWSCVASLCPGYKESRAWLRVKGKSLYQYI